MTSRSNYLLNSLIAESRYGLSVPSTTTGDLPIVGMSNITDGDVDLDDLPTVSKAGVDLEAYRLRRGDILFNRTNSPALVGKSGFVRQDPPGDVVFASYLVRFRAHGHVEPAYIHYALNSPDGQRQIKKIATRGVSQANVNPSLLLTSFRLAVPPLPEQRQIVAVLDAWRDAIRLLEAEIAALQGRAHAIASKLLWSGNRRKLPLVAINSFASEVNIRNTDRRNLPVLSCTKHSGLVPASDFFGKRIHSADTSKYKVVSIGEYVYATNHIEEGSIGYQRTFAEALVSPMYTVFRTDFEQVDNRYLFRVLKTETCRRMFAAATNGTVNRRGSLRWAEFKKIAVPLPAKREQRSIADTLDLLDKELGICEKLRAALRTQHRALVTHLLTSRS